MANDADWSERVRDAVLAQENRAFAYALPNLRDIADRMHVEGCFICEDPLTDCDTPERCGIAKPQGTP